MLGYDWIMTHTYKRARENRARTSDSDSCAVGCAGLGGRLIWPSDRLLHGRDWHAALIIEVGSLTDRMPEGVTSMVYDFNCSEQLDGPSTGGKARMVWKG